MSTYNRELSYDQEIDTVKGIKFSVLSPEEITRRSVVEVTKNDTFSGSDPIVGGLFDPRMGVLETNRTCSTCQQKNLFCPGHFGHINLARPIYHPMFFDTVRKLLKCVCHRCSRPLVSHRSTKEEIRAEVQRIGAIVNQQKRWDALLKLHTKLKLKRCGDDHGKDDEENSGCQAVQPSRYQKESSGLKIMAEWKEGTEVIQREFTAEDILRIFKRISEEDMKLMGFDPRWNKPEWMICTVLPVPPPAVRPSIIEDSGQRREDDLTHKLCDIIKYNTQLKLKMESGKANEENIKILTNLVQYHVATFMDNQIPGMPVAQQRNGRKLKSIADRLKKKEGRIRGNLNGKRVDQSARSVITPDPYVSLDELGVPLRIAMNLTFPEVVNKYNIEYLRSLVQAGVDEWPGAKYVRRTADGITISLKFANRDEVADKLQVGDTVDRHMMDGDYVLFNRQPSLHKMSMMGFKVRVMQYQTFRLPVLATGCFNADFDGDEMNLFKPQNVQTMSEIKDITAIPFLVLNPRDGKPIVEVIQDTMVGSFRLTKDWVTINDKAMANLQMVNSYFDGVLPTPDPHTNMYTGKQAFSAMLPPGLFISMTNKAEEKFVIENSVITSGTVDKSVFHSMSKGIIPVLFHDYSPFEVRRFLDNTQRLMCRWLTLGGFSVGISDIIVDDKTNEHIKVTINKKKKEAYEMFQDVRKGTFKNMSIFSNEENFEREIRNILNDMNKELSRTKLDDKVNRMINMIQSGSKGKPENVAQMVAAVGQQNVDGKRVSYGFTDRTLPHYTKYDDGPESRGFVENSFISGLTPQEVFFHAMGGREGLIDTAVRTSETGYIQRRLVKAMEDAKVYYDQTVRNATGALVQYLYGEDGMDGTKIEKQFIPYIAMNIIEMDNLYHLRPEDPLNLFLTEKAMKSLGPPGEWYPRCKAHFDALLDDKYFLINDVFQGKKEDRIQYPIPFDRIISNSMKRLGRAARAPTDLTPGYILDKIDDLIDRLKVIRVNQGIRFLHILLRVHLSPKVILLKHSMSKAVFDWITEEIERNFIEAVVHPGEMVGVVAAQSIGELSTQQSVTKDTQIKILAHGKVQSFTGTIGEFIDTLVANSPEDVVDLGRGSVVLDLKDDYYIVGISTTEKTAWQRISQVSRHPANGQLMKVTTKSGRSVTATMSHSFLKRGPTGIVPVLGADLKIGNRIPVAKYIPGFGSTEAEQHFNINYQDDIVPEIGAAISILPQKDMTRTQLNAYVDLVTGKDKALLLQAVDADAVYDEITEIEYIPDNGEHVYDFTVPGNDSFMVNAGILVHNTLDSFHSSGTVAAVKATSGVSRLKELLNVSKNIKTPTMFIYMKPDISTIINPVDKDEAGREVKDPRIDETKKRSMKVKTQLEMARISDIVDSTDIYWDPPGADGLATGVEEDNQILEVYRAFAMVDQQRCRSTSPWVLRININKEKLLNISLTMIDIYIRLISAYNQQIDCVFSDDNADRLVFIVRLTAEALKDVDGDDAVAALKAMEYNLVNSVLLKGTKGIKKVSMRPVTTSMFNQVADQFDTVTEWILDTDGTNLQEILANPNIDSTRTRSNDVCEILNILGIEAARNVLHQEFIEVVGADALNYRHMSLLLDTMTNRGTLMSVDRHGINRGDIGPLAKSSFEETTDMLIEASIFSQHDHINGVSANIMLGQVPPCGTGDHNIYIDEKEYVRLIKTYAPADEPPADTVADYVTETTSSQLTFQESCSSSALAFTFNVPQKETNTIQLPKIVFK
jgi:DNA-directed RNA polymerase II subunit RPB1